MSKDDKIYKKQLKISHLPKQTHRVCAAHTRCESAITNGF